MWRGRGRRDNELIGQTVLISQGPYKGQSATQEAVSCDLVLETALTHFPTFPRLHWSGEGRDRVHSPSRAALHLSDDFRGPTASNDHVCPPNPSARIQAPPTCDLNDWQVTLSLFLCRTRLKTSWTIICICPKCSESLLATHRGRFPSIHHLHGDVAETPM